VFVLELAAVAFLLFAAGVIRDIRSFANAVFLGLGLALGALGTAERLEGLHGVPGAPGIPVRLVLLAVALLVVLGPFVAACYLVANGIAVVRREGVRPANLLPLLAGVSVFAVICLDLVADQAGSVKLNLLSSIGTLLFGYASFLLVSYVIYALIYGVYGRIAAFGAADFVVVLGSGLIGGRRVPPLLASRLERGREVHAALVRRGVADPVLIVSGGKGGDERISEAEAMAAYLTERGFPAGRLVREDRSRTTEENLVFSKAIMDQSRPGSRCVIVTSNFHAFRAAIIARRAGVRGQVTGAPTAGYYWPAAMLREFAAVCASYKLVNAAICALIVILPLAYVVVRRF
jgi:uncharacterized SAM-binding protein YcdF (DUF218 family)